ncbi:MAG: hypothetical protein V4473_00425 [Patescibacteria group bacterium]
MNKFVFSAVVLSALFMFSGVVSATVINPGPQYPTSKDQCKKGGWMDFNGKFKNQGDCVSYVATDGRNAPDGPAA